MSFWKFLNAVMTVHATSTLCVVYSRFGSASGQTDTSFISGDALSNFEHVAALLKTSTFTAQLSSG